MKRPDVAQRNKSKAQRKAMSVSHKNGAREAAYAKISESLKGNTNGKHRVNTTHSPETRQKIRENTPVRSGADHHAWKGGITGWQRLERNSSRMKAWIKQVLERDEYTCQTCAVRGGKLEADHVMPFSLFPELRYDLLNGRTLCRKCHQKTFITKDIKRQLLGFQLP